MQAMPKNAVAQASATVDFVGKYATAKVEETSDRALAAR
jgi:hypothetical protein